MTAMPPEPWAEGDHLPWDDPGFSERMLKEHLSQKHDGASRRFETIDRHVRWIHDALPGGRPSRILDLGCGPGLYLQRLAELGHRCAGIDFSPASIAHARDVAKRSGASIQYFQEDIRNAEFGADLDLVMLIHGEFNVFRPADAEGLLVKAINALRAGGRLLLEVSSFEMIRGYGTKPASESTCATGLFLGSPHVCLEESFWDAERCAATKRWSITNNQANESTVYAASYQAYTDQQYEDRLRECGFATVERHPTLTGETTDQSKDWLILAGRK